MQLLKLPGKSATFAEPPLVYDCAVVSVTSNVFVPLLNIVKVLLRSVIPTTPVIVTELVLKNPCEDAVTVTVSPCATALVIVAVLYLFVALDELIGLLSAIDDAIPLTPSTLLVK